MTLDEQLVAKGWYDLGPPIVVRSLSCREYPTKSNGGKLRKFFKKRGNRQQRRANKL